MKSFIEMLRFSEYSTFLEYALRLAAATEYHSEAMDMVEKCHDWKTITPGQAMIVARRTGYPPELIRRLVRMHQIPIDTACVLAEGTSHHWLVVSTIIERRSCTLERALTLVKKAHAHELVVYSLLRRADWRKLSQKERTRLANGVGCFCRIKEIEKRRRQYA